MSMLHLLFLKICLVLTQQIDLFQPSSCFQFHLNILGCVYWALITVEGTAACDYGIITRDLECLFIPLKMTLTVGHQALHCGFLSTGQLLLQGDALTCDT